jgi:hypothetical protein
VHTLPYTPAAAFIYPSLSEGFGLPPLEAMAAGTPVITSAISAIPEIAAGDALLIDPRSPSEIGFAIQRQGWVSQPLRCNAQGGQGKSPGVLLGQVLKRDPEVVRTLCLSNTAE